MFVHCIRLSFEFSSGQPVLQDADFTLRPGWTGVVGANGSGKTTLLRLLAAELLPSGGSVAVHPPSAHVVLCPQLVENLTRDVVRLGTAETADAHRLRDRLCLDVGRLERWPQLSPGERRRWQVGGALFSAPEVLMLDEPTNHLDGAGRALLVASLQNFRGIGLLVSHDRGLLDSLTAATLRLHETRARLWPGAYTAARAAWRQAEAARLHRLEGLQHEMRTVAARLASRRSQQHGAAASVSIGSRARGRSDHDARTMAAKNRVRQAEARIGREVGVLRRRMTALREQTAEVDLRKARGREVRVATHDEAPARLLSCNVGLLSAGNRPVLRDLHLALDRRDKVRLAGPNGSGKSTLVEALVGAWRLPSERLLYLPQELGDGDRRRLLESLRSLPTEERGRVLQRAAALGLDPDRLLLSSQPSPGEARKLLLAFGLGRGVWALVLDEPTNHLDLPSIERLEEALADFDGALLLVTHDDQLAARCTRVVWRIEHGSIALA